MKENMSLAVNFCSLDSSDISSTTFDRTKSVSMGTEYYTEAVAETLRNFGGASAEGMSFLGGSGGMPPPKIFKIWTPEMAFAAF